MQHEAPAPSFQILAVAAQERQHFFCSINEVIEPTAAVGELAQLNVTFAGKTTEITVYKCVWTLRVLVCTQIWQHSLPQTCTLSYNLYC